MAKRIPEQVTISTVWCECEICERASFGWTDMWREGEAGVVDNYIMLLYLCSHNGMTAWDM